MTEGQKQQAIEESIFPNSFDVVASFLRDKRIQAGYNTLAELIRSDTRNPVGAFQQYERGRFPKSPEQSRLMDYFSSIGLTEDEIGGITDSIRILHGDILPKSMTWRPISTPKYVRPAPTRNVSFSSINGRPARYIKQEIEERGREGGGLIIGRDPHTGYDWLGKLALNHNASAQELSLDEAVFLATYIGGAYSSVESSIQHALNHSNISIDQADTEGLLFMTFPAFATGIFTLQDALPDERPKGRDHLLTTLDPTAEAIDTKLKMLELEGYESARLARGVLREARDGYMNTIGEAYKEMHRIAEQKLVAAENP